MRPTSGPGRDHQRHKQWSIEYRRLGLRERMERDYRAHQCNTHSSPGAHDLFSRSDPHFIVGCCSEWALGVVWASEITMAIERESGEDRDHRRLAWGHGMSRCGHPHAVTDPCNNSDINITSNKYIFIPDRRYHSVRSIWIAQHVWLIAPAIITWPQLAGEQLTFRN